MDIFARPVHLGHAPIGAAVAKANYAHCVAHPVSWGNVPYAYDIW